MGFGHRATAPGIPIANPQAWQGGRLTAHGGRRGAGGSCARELRKRKPDYVIATNVEFYSAVAPGRRRRPARADARDVRLLAWPAGRRTSSSRSDRTIVQARRPLRRPASAVAVRCLSWRQPLRREPRSPSRAPSASLLGCGRNGPTRSRRPPARTTTASAPSRAIGQFRFRQKTELLRRGLEDESPCLPRLRADLARASRATIPGWSTSSTDAPRAVDSRRQPGRQATRRHVSENGSPQRETILILSSIADDDEQDRELRNAAGKIGEVLRKKGAARR